MDETLRRQFTRAQAQIFPLGHAQERTLGVVYFLNRYGPALVDRLFSELPLELFEAIVRDGHCIFCGQQRFRCFGYHTTEELDAMEGEE